LVTDNEDLDRVEDLLAIRLRKPSKFTKPASGFKYPAFCHCPCS